MTKSAAEKVDMVQLIVAPYYEAEAFCLKIAFGVCCLKGRCVALRPGLTRPAAEVALQSRGS